MPTFGRTRGLRAAQAGGSQAWDGWIALRNQVESGRSNTAGFGQEPTVAVCRMLEG